MAEFRFTGIGTWLTCAGPGDLKSKVGCSHSTLLCITNAGEGVDSCHTAELRENGPYSTMLGLRAPAPGYAKTFRAGEGKAKGKTRPVQSRTPDTTASSSKLTLPREAWLYPDTRASAQDKQRLLSQAGEPLCSLLTLGERALESRSEFWP